MRNLADFEKEHNRTVLCDFVCPTKETQNIFHPDIIIWMNTIKKGRYEDTNKMFENPTNVDYEVNEFNDKNHNEIAKKIIDNV